MGRTVFTTITAIPAGVTRETVMETLRDHLEMIDLNPTHEERIPIKPPPEASPEEYHCKWYQILDKISYLPGMKGDVRFKACFHDLPMGLQTHVYAPMGLDIKEKWTLGGNLPHEPVQPVEIGVGAPITGLYLREDVEMKCNFLMTKFVKKQLKDALATLVARLVVKSQLVEAVHQNRRLTYDPSNPASQFQPPLSPPMSPRNTASPPLSGGMGQMEYPQSPPPTGGLGMQMDYPSKWVEEHAQQQQQQGNQRNSYVTSQYSPPTQFSQQHQPSQHSPQYPTQQAYQQQLAMQQQQQQQRQAQHGQQGPNEQGQQAASELDNTQNYSGVHHGYYGPAELPS